MFHYTDSAGLLGILDSRSLFATDYRYLNDTSEGSIFRALLLPILEDDAREVMTTLTDGGIVTGFTEYHGAHGPRLQAEGFYHTLESTLQNVSPLFVLSFCRHKEDTLEYKHGLLSQWRAYGGAAGFAIEFDEDRLDDLITVESSAYAYGAMRSKDVRYGDYEKLFDPAAYKGVAGELIRVIFEASGQDVSAITGNQLDMDTVFQAFAKTAPFLKHAGFKEENEYRVAAACIRHRKLPASVGLPAKEIKFRDRRGLIIPYIELCKGSRTTLPIKAIIVGPHPLQEKQADAVKLALESTPFAKAEVRRSEIPFSA